MFNKLKSLKTAEALSRNVWAYLVQLIPWKTIGEDWLTFDSSVLVRYGEQEGAKKGYNPAKHGRPSHSPLLAFLNGSSPPPIPPRAYSHFIKQPKERCICRHVRG
jgi:hypothetical protein